MKTPLISNNVEYGMYLKYFKSMIKKKLLKKALNFNEN
tara:strand:+ start:247 stop:360 length:114 start_codon:yes stop_codon:yes gene_type:complete